MKRLLLLFTGLSALLLAGCSKEAPQGNVPAGAEGGGVRFEMHIGATTRVTTEGTSYRSEWQDGDWVAIYAVKNGEALAANGNYIHGAKLSFDGTDWRYIGPEIYYPLDGSGLDFYACYCRTFDNVPEPTSILWNVPSDQSSQGSFNNSEFLSAVALNQKGHTVRLDFTHALALVEVRADRVAPVPAFREGALTVTLENVYLKGRLDWTTGAMEANVTGSPLTNITMYRVDTGDPSEWVFRALVPAQEKDAGTLFRFTQYSATKNDLKEIDMVYETGPVTLKGGEASVRAVTLDYGLDPDHRYKRGDYYPYKGTPVGVVYWIDPASSSDGGTTGLHGWIVSLDEENSLAWGSDATASATNLDDGLVNMAAVKGHSNDFTGYPAFAWCDSKNGMPGSTAYASGATGVWYLPAYNELKSLSDAWNAGRAVFDGRLTAAGGTAISVASYWSSTEVGYVDAWYVNFFNGITYGDSKNFPYRVRAVMAF